jgi:hypothetical protein
MSKIEKIKKISAQISEIETINSLLESKNIGKFLEEKEDEYSQKKLKVLEKITAQELKLNKIRSTQKAPRQIFQEIQGCINLYIQ